MVKEIGLRWLRQSMRQLTNNTDPDLCCVIIRQFMRQLTNNTDPAPWCVIIWHDNVRRQNRMQTRASHDETSIENP